MEDSILFELKKINHHLEDVDARLEIIEARIGAQEKSNREIRNCVVAAKHVVKQPEEDTY